MFEKTFSRVFFIKPEVSMSITNTQPLVYLVFKQGCDSETLLIHTYYDDKFHVNTTVGKNLM